MDRDPLIHLGEQGDHHGRIVAALALVDRAGPGRHQMVEFAPAVDHRPAALMAALVAGFRAGNWSSVRVVTDHGWAAGLVVLLLGLDDRVIAQRRTRVEELARAQAGEVVEITSHHRPIARLRGSNSPKPPPANPLQAAIDAGIVSWNGKKPVFPPPVVLTPGGKSVSELVLEGRD